MKKLRSCITVLIALVLMGVVTACGGGSSSVPTTIPATPAESQEAQTESVSEETAEETTEAPAETEETTPAAEAALADGTYIAEFDTDSSMFHVNEANEGKGILTVENGKMTIHVSLVSKKILNLYQGLAEDAQKDGAELLQPTTDTVTYSDGFSEEVYGFDVPVPYLDEEFDCALIGESGKWYDHKVSVSNPEPYEESEDAGEGEEIALEDGNYMIEVTLEGGSGKATVDSPTEIRVAGGEITAVIIWSSPNYDYMIVDGDKLLPINESGNSVFEIPVSALGVPLEVKADTVAMSTPHEIDYTLTFDPASVTPAE